MLSVAVIIFVIQAGLLAAALGQLGAARRELAELRSARARREACNRLARELGEWSLS